MKLLQAAGFEDVVGLDGGIAAWQAANLPTVK
jgi:rhodanese-related sulfurtransferase